MQQRQEATERISRRTRRRPAPRYPRLSKALGLVTLIVMLLLVGVWLIDRSDDYPRGSAEPEAHSLIARLERLERLVGRGTPPNAAAPESAALGEPGASSGEQVTLVERGAGSSASEAVRLSSAPPISATPSAQDAGANGATGASSASSADETPRDARVSGRVVDATGGPIPGAKVRVHFVGLMLERQGKTGLFARSPAPDAEWITNAQGQFEGQAPAGSIALAASAEAYTEAHEMARAPTENVVLVLAPGARVTGRVQRADGSAVNGASLRITPRGFDQAPIDGSSDARGEFSIGAIPAGVIEVTASASGLSSAREWLRLTIGEVAPPLVFTLAAAHSIHGVVRIPDGSPCMAGIVRVSGQLQEIGDIDAQGHYRVDGLDEGTHELAVTCHGLATATRSIPVSADSPASIELNWQLDAGFSLAGSVHRKNGQPLAGAMVLLHAVSPPDGTASNSDPFLGTISGSSCRADAAGVFQCGGLRAGWYRAHAGSPSGASSSSEPVRVDAETKAWVELIIPDSGEVRVRIADGARLGEHFLRGVFAHGGDTIPIPATPRGDSFVFEDLALGRYRIAIGRATTEAGRSAVDIELTRPGQVIDVELRAPEIMTIGGTVVDANGAPVPDAWVQASLSEVGIPLLQSASKPALSNTDGRFEIGDLPSGRYAVTARHAGGEGQALDVNTGQRNVRLVVEAYGSLSGRVTTANGQPARRFTVLAYRETPGQPLHVDGERGSWSLPWVAPGSYRIIFMSPIGGASSNALVTSGSDTALEVQLDPALAGSAMPKAKKAKR